MTVTQYEVVAIIGMAFRLPGSVATPERLWQALMGGEDLVTQVDPSRWAVDDLQHPRRGEPGRSITFAAGVIDGVDQFDAGFFGISPREAELMDPQQRLTLELAWEALEDAGIPPSTLAGTDCAVYLGISGLDYGMRLLDDLPAMTAHTMTGNTMSVAANRLSYKLDLRGPSVAVDTACSSAMVALHQACVALRAGDASAALVGGVNLLLHPYPFVGFTKASMLSANGRCRTFAEGGDGYVRAEGGGMLVLKPLAAARRDGDRVLAVIRGSGVNNDGARKSGMTIPSGEAQRELMSRVLAGAGLRGADIDYVEAHGTGTPVGDPIEAKAVGAVYGQGREAKLPIGSIKSNLGHMESASSIAGLAKAMLVLRHGVVPPGLHAERLNQKIDFDGLNLHVVRQPYALPSGRTLRVAVNSFGFGGVNGHVILEAAPPPARPASVPVVSAPLVLSAHDDAALRELARRYLPLLQVREARPAVVHAAWTRRQWLQERLALPGLTGETALDVLAQFAAGEAPPALVRERALPAGGKVAFIYSGNGAQWVGMGRDLAARSRCFAVALSEVAGLILRHGGPDVAAALESDDPAIFQATEIAQPALFALQVSLTALLRAEGLEPEAVMGHSVGEVAAAWAAGCLDLESAARVIVARSSAQALTRGAGRMAAMGLGLEPARELLVRAGVGAVVEIAAENSPRNVTLSGAPEALEALAKMRAAPFFKNLDIDYAFHSACMNPIREGLHESLAGLRPRAAGMVPFYSSVTGGGLSAPALDASYWWRNVREPVRFGPALASMAADGCRIFIEIGPNAILQRYITETLEAERVEARVFATAPRRQDTLENAQAAVLRAILAGARVKQDILLPAGPAPHPHLPTYPWQRQRYWVARTVEAYALFDRPSHHELLGYRLKEPPASWESQLDQRKLPYLADHKVGGAVVLAGASYLEMALAASREWFGGESFIVEDLDIVSPVVFDGEHARTLRVVFSPADLRIRIESRQRLTDAPWTLHAQGRLLGAAPAAGPPALAAPGEDEIIVDREQHYAQARAMGLDYGPAFRGIGVIALDERQLSAQLSWAEGQPEGEGYLLHPAVLDQCFQALLGWLGVRQVLPSGMTFLPISFGRLCFWREAGAAVALRARLRQFSARAAAADFELLDAQGRLVARLEGARFRAAALVHSAGAPACWITQATPLPLPGQTPPLPETAQLRRLLEELVPPSPAGERFFTQVAPLVEMLPLAYVRDALLQGGTALRAAWRGGHPWQRWLLALAEAEGVVGGTDESPVREQDLPDTSTIWRAVFADAPALAPELLRIGRIGRALARDPLLDPAALTARLGEAPVNLQSPLLQGARQAVAAALTRLLAHWPPGRPVRILDLGTDGEPWLAGLRPRLAGQAAHYVIARTDEALRARLQVDHADGEAEIFPADPKSLALPEETGTFDIVLAAHALHGLARPADALRAVAPHLAPDGLLLLVERHADRASDFAHGAAEGWWRGAAGRLLPPAGWRDLLEGLGWEIAAMAQDPDGAALELGGFLLAARPPARAAVAAAGCHGLCAVLADDAAWDPLAEALAARIAADGGAATRVLPAEACEHVVLFSLAPGFSGGAAALAGTCERLRRRLLELAQCQPGARVWVVTCGGALQDDPNLNPPSPDQAAIWGMVRTAANELTKLRLTLLDLPGAMVELAPRVAAELAAAPADDEIVLTPTARLVLRMRALDTALAATYPAWKLDFTLAGQLRNLHWRACARRELAADEIEIEARAAGLNFRDIMYATGLLPDEALENGFAGATLGLEVAGRVARVGAAVRALAPGDDVLAFAGASFASHVVVPARGVVKMPAGWGYAEAATVPTVFFTVWYALSHLARLQPGERVLIHGAAGGVGLAAIQVAQHLGAEVFASAGTEARRDFVSLLGADHVVDSRSAQFDQAVLDLTHGEGVDVILNSLAGEAISRNLRAIRPFGRFIELGKRDFYENTAIGLKPFRNNVSYFGVDADQLMQLMPALAREIFEEIMALFAQGALSPLPYRLFPADEVTGAFRYMQQARQIGKVVVDLSVPPRNVRAAAEPALRLREQATYLITGGLAGFGREAAFWLAARGARHLALVSRQGDAAPEAAQTLAKLRALGVAARAFACDVADRSAVAALLARLAAEMPPLRGVVHGAMVLDDAALANLDEARFARVLAPKLDGALALHELTRDLELFVLFSSGTTMLGNPGQANYVAANAALEGLALARRRAGLPGCAVAWGPIEDVGVLTRNEAARVWLQNKLGVMPIAAARALGALGPLLARGGVAAVMDLDWPALAACLPRAKDSRFDELRNGFGSNELAHQGDLQQQLKSLPEAEAHQLMLGVLEAETAGILRLPLERIRSAQSVFDFGMDSLMAVEFALALEKRLGVTVQPMLINENPSLDKIADRLLATIRGEAAEAEDAGDVLTALIAHHGEQESMPEIEGLLQGKQPDGMERAA
jgi:acyl transferase domain-containing protein/NADPH:quinone reductase-like Zn-dependent oxidoreductase/acyl carrier protein